ncbi:MAG: ATP-binding cassette domain-containing protein [Clostridia bacterium]|nr:ATP-binding cassette domain-containing protein [Clostridia bacterium]
MAEQPERNERAPVSAGEDTGERAGTVAEARELRLVYQEPERETEAVADVSFAIRKGEFVSLVGPSGCGKTRILSMLAGRVPPTGGEVKILGQPPDPRANAMGYMLQRDHLLDWRTIEDNVLLGLEVKGRLNAETRAYAGELLGLCGLGGFRRHYPRQLSGGMRQKAALVRTLAFSPELVLLDEPFSALDYQQRLLLGSEVHGIIKGGGYTAVLVTHDISEAIAMSDRVLIFTKRPARLRRELAIEPELGGEGRTPLERRSLPRFNEYFDLVWGELEGGLGDESERE